MENIKAGVARECITPPLGTPLSGYFNPRYAKGVIDDLYATAVAFDDGENKSVIISLDLCGLKNQWWLDDCKKMISEFLNIPEEAIMVNCSHTHTGPIVGCDESSGVDSNHEYDNILMQKLRDVSYKALENASEAKFYLNKNEVKNFPTVRQYRVKDGTLRMCGGLTPDDIIEPIGKANNTATLIKIERENDEDIFIVNFWCHADLIGGEYVSADYIGVMRSVLEAAIPDTKVVFLQGAEGNIATYDPYSKETDPKEYIRALKFGRRLAGGVLQMCTVMEEVEAHKVKFMCKSITIPSNQENHRLDEAKKVFELHRSGRTDEIDKDRMTAPEAIRILRLENGPEEFSFYLTAISIGDIVFAGLPGEPFCEIGQRIMENSPFKETVICALTNGGEIYFPTKAVMEEGNYIYEARSSMVKKGADDILVNEMSELLNNFKS